MSLGVKKKYNQAITIQSSLNSLIIKKKKKFSDGGQYQQNKVRHNETLQKKKHIQIHTYWPKQDSKKKLLDNTANRLSSHKNVRAIVNVPDSTTFCILFIHSLLLLPTISYIVVYCISRDHPPRASMMMFLGKPRNTSV